MPFRFALATVLQVREGLEKKEERALQKIQIEISRALHQIDELSAEIQRSKSAREAAMKQPVQAIHLHMLLAAADVAERKRKVLRDSLLKLELQRDQQIKIYRAAHCDRETLTDMSDKQRDAYDQKQTRLQQKSLDDIFIARRQRS
jgi:flagellar export protein FliJ